MQQGNNKKLKSRSGISLERRREQKVFAIFIQLVVLANICSRQLNAKIDRAISDQKWDEARHVLWLPMSATRRSDCLVLAAGAGDIVPLKSISKDQVNQPGTHGERILNAAAAGGHTSLVETLVKQGAELDAMGKRSPESTVTETALDSASRTHHFETALFLLNRGADPNNMPVDTLPGGINNEAIVPALFNATEAADVHMVSSLLQHHADPNECTALKEPPLMAAVNSAHREDSKNALACANLLIAAGARQNIKDMLGDTPLFKAAAAGSFVLTERFVSAGAQIDAPDNDGTTPFMAALLNGNVHAAQFLLEHGANVSAINRNQITPAGIARTRCRALIPAIENKGGHLSLMEAVSAGDTGEISYRLSHGSNANSLLPDRSPMLSLAAKNGQLKAMRQLLDAGANVNASDPSGWTPLMVAATNGNAEAVRLLLVHHANIHAANMAARTAFDLLKHLSSARREEVLKALTEVRSKKE